MTSAATAVRNPDPAVLGYCRHCLGKTYGRQTARGFHCSACGLRTAWDHLTVAPTGSIFRAYIDGQNDAAAGRPSRHLDFDPITSAHYVDGYNQRSN